ncbi:MULTISPECIES: hypothetical protein [unclassified Ensifer]|uniref:hypothetical protein n=1 Tax=unclassified Ensifer TaxID=2633371 RepID=UPI00081334D2|nr:MULTISPECIES: hypothetical protein [unclassified Ensifer]OCP01769.1 hypothetical protein BC362_21370 [Ensifer sp. LC14]OCP09558.1 hypothetical protein BC374_03110 [Ensifer sp. LC13]OCP10730.1 hypothetical protein BBX50_03455 [Ensifer sp. LC11]OCP32805.1 hypothetical protein BC364_03110 [Ensifer sp. LC499]
MPRGTRSVSTLQLGKQRVRPGNAGLEPSDKKGRGKAKAFLIIEVDVLMKACTPQHAIQHC